jgi:hypothetical protein
MDCRLKINRLRARCRLLRSISKIPKKDLKWFQAKVRYPKLSPKGNADGDKHKNKKDCRPFDKKRHKEDYDLPDYGDITTSPRLYKAFEIVRYGREMGLSPRDTHDELKKKGFSGDEMRSANSLYDQFRDGKNITSYGYDIHSRYE